MKKLMILLPKGWDEVEEVWIAEDEFCESPMLIDKEAVEISVVEPNFLARPHGIEFRSLSVKRD